ncbi:(2Fe-2S)-binding protein [Glycomyces sp. NRRL B-16210]|uniref:(2Fe-2S)-binding protein n=1 Tax=Glycomyces sp. NRRL B-16210 TaxID=1463821 RepID=UPI001E400533|nr:2Fe-2S iron-sulfur cluster-binding protein [Glycomyces sp. NRRL B-16210]
MRVDGADTAADIDRPGESLLATLRDRLALTGTKNACEQGECGSCTVLLDGDPVCACLVATAQCEGREVRTVVGAVPRAVRDAFLTCGAVQCGFCTPGLLVTVADLLEREADPSDLRIREALAGNLCRCTGYEKIIEAVHVAAAASVSGAEEARATDATAWPEAATTPAVDAPAPDSVAPSAAAPPATERTGDARPSAGEPQ